MSATFIENRADVSDDLESLRQTVKRQAEELEMLSARLELTDAREAELRKLLLEAYGRLEEQRSQDMRARGRIKRALSARVPRLASLYRRVRWRTE